MQVEFDDWGVCTEGTGFTVEMPVAPRVGESVTIEREVLPEQYRAGMIDPDVIELVVTDRKLYVTARGTIVQCDVELPEVR